MRQGFKGSVITARKDSFYDNSERSQQVMITVSGNLSTGTRKRLLDFGCDLNVGVDPRFFIRTC